MTTYVIGDVQGCYDSLQCLLEKITFDPSKDKLWFAGDLVNRGPESLKALRLIKQIANKVVLGNHDLHLLACHYGRNIQLKRKDTMGEILQADDRDELLHWLCQQPLLACSNKHNAVMSHAGIPHIWSIDRAKELSKEVETVLRSDDKADYFDAMYGNEPDVWSESLTGLERLRVITNYFTRMRFITDSGQLEFNAKESIEQAPTGFRPWFQYERPQQDVQTRIFFGHWAALNGQTGVETIVATDTGCVWGNKLTAIKLKTGERIACECQ